jgi:hypothetical protein
MTWPAESDSAAGALTPGWWFVHIGTEGDGVPIDGVSVWDVRWVSTRDRVMVTHPQCPNQRHSMWTYRAETSGHAVEFVAGEFSNRVWGLFVRDRPS